MKNLKYIKTFENFNTDATNFSTNEEMILPGPGALGALYAPFLPFLIAIQSTKAVFDRVKFRKAKRFLGDFFEKIATDLVIKQIADGLTTGSIYPNTDGMSNGRAFHICSDIKKREIQKALDRIKEISEEGDYEKFVEYMKYMNNDNDSWKEHAWRWPIFTDDPYEIGFDKRKTSFFDVDDTLGDLSDIKSKIASIF